MIVKRSFIFIISFLLGVLLIMSPTSSARAGTITYKYDELDRLWQVWYDVTNYIEYEYDKIGNLISKTPKGNVASITATTTGSGNIYPAGATSLFSGGSITYSFTPAPGGQLVALTVDGVAKALAPTYQFSTVTSPHTIDVRFTIVQKTVNFAAGPHGTISGPTPQNVNYNTSAFPVTANPATGYKFVNWTGTNGFVATTSNPLIVTNVTTDQTITANFVADPNGTPPGPPSHINMTPILMLLLND